MTERVTPWWRVRMSTGSVMSSLGRVCMYVVSAVLLIASGCAPATDQATKHIFVPEWNGKTLNLAEMLCTWDSIVDPATGKPIPQVGGGHGDILRDVAGRLEFREGVTQQPFGPGFMDATGRLVARTPGWTLPEGKSLVSKTTAEGKYLYGIIGRDGHWVVAPRYEYLGEMSEGRCAFRIGNRWGFLDTVGNEVIPPKFGSREGKELAPSFHDGLAAVVDESEGLVYIDKAGNIAIRPPDMCVYIDNFSGGLARIKVLDTEKVSKEAVDDVRTYCHKGALTDIFVSGKPWGCGSYSSQTGYLSVSGRMAIPPSRKESYRFVDGLSVAYMTGDQGLDANGITVNFDATVPHGYINISGNWAIPPQFEEAKTFSEGLARVKSHGLWGYIDISGKFVIEPKYVKAEDFRGGVAEVWEPNKERDGLLVHLIDRMDKTILVIKEDYIPID